MKVIPAINAVKAQLAAVQKSVSVHEAVVAEFRAAQAELSRKVGELGVGLADVRANVKILESWMVAMEFAQVPGGSGVSLCSSSAVAPVDVGGVLDSASGTVFMPDMTSADIDRLLGMDGGSTPLY